MRVESSVCSLLNSPYEIPTKKKKCKKINPPNPFKYTNVNGHNAPRKKVCANLCVVVFVV